MVTEKHLLAYRRRVWQTGRVRNQSHFTRVLDRVGLCLIFGSDEVPLPKVYDVAHEDCGDWWNWKDHLQAKKAAYLGRMIRGKATLVTMELLPTFLALHYEQGGCASYDEEHYYGRLTQTAKWICDRLDREGPCPADELRKFMKRQHGAGTSAYHRALLELQRRFKIVTVGLVDRHWGTRVIGLFERWVPREVERRAQRLAPEQARRAIVERILRTAGAVPVPALTRTLGWPPAEAARALDSLARTGIVHAELCPRRRQRRWVVHRALG